MAGVRLPVIKLDCEERAFEKVLAFSWLSFGVIGLIREHGGLIELVDDWAKG